MKTLEFLKKRRERDVERLKEEMSNVISQLQTLRAELDNESRDDDPAWIPTTDHIRNSWVGIQTMDITINMLEKEANQL